VQAYALVEAGHREAVGIYLWRADADRELKEILADEPDWAGLFYVVPIELDERNVSNN
jgi:hypothetical protein